MIQKDKLLLEEKQDEIEKIKQSVDFEHIQKSIEKTKKSIINEIGQN